MRPSTGREGRPDVGYTRHPGIRKGTEETRSQRGELFVVTVIFTPLLHYSVPLYLSTEIFTLENKSRVKTLLVDSPTLPERVPQTRPFCPLTFLPLPSIIKDWTEDFI